MKFYIATKLENHEEHRKLKLKLESLGHEITYDWTIHGPVYKEGINRVAEVARAEIEGVTDANWVFVLWPGGRGTHVELGAAIVGLKRIFYVSPVEDHHIASSETCAFYHHPFVERFNSIKDLMRVIVKLS